MSAFQKPVIIITARQHPGESPASFVLEGFIRALLNPGNSDRLLGLLTICELHLVPMLNPDGVVVGNSRVSLAGVDLNR